MNNSHSNNEIRNSDIRNSRIGVNPSDWWRRLCHITGTGLTLSGDLVSGHAQAVRQITEWVQAGITHVIDVRVERSDQSLVAMIAPHITYIHLGVDDAGQEMPDEWFESGVAAALEALSDPDSRVLVHCHMGVNRGPSMGFAILLALGFSPLGALNAILSARPIAVVAYAGDALNWWHRREERDSFQQAYDFKALAHWERTCRPDAGWVISRMWRAAS